MSINLEMQSCRRRQRFQKVTFCKKFSIDTKTQSSYFKLKSYSSTIHPFSVDSLPGLVKTVGLNVRIKQCFQIHLM